MSEQNTNYLGQVLSALGLMRDRVPGSVSSQPGRGGDGTIAVTVPDGTPATPDSRSAEFDATFDARLKEFFSGRSAQDTLIAGRVHLINVDAVRQRLGARWPRLEERIHQIIRTELQARLSPQDLFGRVGNDSYVIFFGNASEAEASLKMGLLSEQILKMLLGDEAAADLEALGVRRLIAKADGSVTAEKIDSTTSLLAILDGANSTEAPAEASEIDDDLPVKRGLTEKEVAALLQDGADHGGVADAGSTEARGASAEDRTASQSGAPDEDRPAAEPAGPAADSDVVFEFQPIWHAPSNKIGIYACNVHVRDKHQMRINLCSYPDSERLGIQQALDRLALRKVSEETAGSDADGVPHILMVPVHYATISNVASKINYVRICHQLSDSQSKALGWEIRDAPVATWYDELPLVIKPLLPFGRAFFLRVTDVQNSLPKIAHEIQFLRGAGIKAIGIDIRELEGGEARKLAILDKLALLSEKAGLGCYADGFESLSMTVCAVCMGYQHVAGPAIGTAGPAPFGLLAKDLESIYAHMLPARDIPVIV